MRVLVALALSVLSPLVHAQPGLDGRWNATFTAGGDDQRTAEIRIDGSGGTWTTQPRPNKDKKDPCVGRAFPITVIRANDGKLTIEMKASAELSGCRDRKAQLAPGPAGMLEGLLDNGQPIRLAR